MAQDGILSSANERLEIVPLSSSERGAQCLALKGVMTFRTAGDVSLKLLRTLPSSGQTLTLDLAELTSIDSVGVALLVRIWRISQLHGFVLKLENVSPPVLERLNLYEVQETPVPPPEPVNPFESLGEQAYSTFESAYQVLLTAADVTIELLTRIVTPWKLRWEQLLMQAVLVGSSATGVVTLITFLVGLTLAFQSAYQLRQFGASIYVASLTAISMVREMGPLITAILVAGRSGSSITSEVATMRVNEETDAMEVIGIPFLQYIALPRVLALMITLPMLTLMSDVVGICGGWIVGVGYLELGTQQYLNETLSALNVDDIVYSMLKVITFAWGIGIIALYHGFSVSGGAQEVGIATTKSVVHSIFFIIIVTSLYSIVYYVLMGG